MKANVYSMEGEVKEEIELPAILMKNTGLI